MPDDTTLTQLMRDCARDLGGALSQIPVLGTTTSAGGAGGDSFVDSVLKLPDAETGYLDGVWFRVDKQVIGGPAPGEVAVVREGGFAGSSGTVTISALSAQVKSGTDYSLYRHVHPVVLKGFINQALGLMRRMVLYPVSLLTNPDFELVTSGAGVDSWTPFQMAIGGANGYTSTASRVRHGNYAARLQGSGGAPELYQALSVTPGQEFVVAVAGQAVAGTCGLSAYDATHGADIAFAEHAEPGYNWLQLPTISIPSGCYSLEMVLYGLTAGADLSFDDAIIWPVRQRTLELPDFVNDVADVECIGYFERGRPVGTNVYEVDEGRFQAVWYPDPDLDDGGAHPLKVQLDRDVLDPLFMRVARPHAALSADTDTTTATRDVVVKTALWLLFDALATGAQSDGEEAAKAGWLERRDSAGRDARVAAVVKRLKKGSFRVQGLRPGLYGR